MSFFVKGSNGSWASVSRFFVKGANGSWASVQRAFVKGADGSWSAFWPGGLVPEITSPVEIAQSTNSTTKLITLTGTNYKWNNSTGLEYEFNRSVLNTFDTTLDTGTITNPTVSNTKTYLLIDTDVLPNQTNTFTFKVIATNSTYGTTASSSAETTVEGVRDITNLVNTIVDYDFLEFQWSGGQYANSFIYQYQTYNNGVEGTWSSQEVVPSSTTIAGLLNLQPNTTYRFRIKGITGTTTSNQGYSGNWEYQVGTTDQAAAPEQITSPTISGTGYAFSEINGTSGTYTSGTYLSKTSYIGKTTSSTPPTNGLTTTTLSVAGSPPYNVTQNDATTPKYYFYYVDKVTGNDNSFYYYYSSSIDAKIGQITDTFTRSVTGGLGVMTPSWNNAMNPNSYVYNFVTANGSLWSVNGSQAVIASAVSGSNPSSYPQQAVELGGRTDATVSASFPAGPDGLGLTFWATGAGSWWASTVNRTASTINKYVYYTRSTVCDAIGTSSDDYCSTGTETVLGPCTEGTGTAQNNCGSVPTCPENGIGDQVFKCRTRTNDLCPNNGTGNFYTNCKSRTQSVCTDNGNGSSGNYCKTRSVTTCPNNGIGSTSSNCKSRTESTCPANGSGSPGSYCNSRLVTSCPNNGTGSSGTNCKSRTVSSQTCPNNGGGSTSSNCKTRTVTTYSCPTGYSLIGTNCYQNAFPYAVTAATATNTTVYDNFVTTTTTVYDSSTSTTVYDYPSTSTVYDNFQTSTVYDVAGTTTVYDQNVTETIYDKTVDVYSGQTTTTNTVYYIYGCTIGPTTQYGGTLPTNCSNVTSTATVYDTNLRIVNGDGSSANTMDNQVIFSQEEFPSPVAGMTVQTSGNNISTTLYSDTGRTSAITTKNYAASNPDKTTGSGASYFGMIKTPPGSSGGTQFDDFNVN